MRRAFGAATPMPWRRILIGVAALLLLLVALGVFFLATFDANSQKVRLATMVKEKTGRVLSIPADVRLKLFPVIRFELDRAILDEKNSSIPFATIEAVKLSLRLWPLLRRQVILDQVEIGNFSVALQRFANGATNFDDLIAKDESPSSLRFDLAGLTIKNGTLRFDDELAQRKTQFTQLQITTGRLTENIATPVQAKFLLTNDNPVAVLNTELSGELKFDLQKKQYQFTRTKLSAVGAATGLKPITIGLRASIDADLGVGRVALQDLSAIVDGRAGTQTVHAELASPRLTSAPNNLSIEQIGAQLKIDDLVRKISVSATVPALVSVGNKIDASDFKLDFSIEQDKLRSSGVLSAALTFDPVQQRATLAKMTLNSKTQRNQLVVEASAIGPLMLNLQTGELDSTQLHGDWKMQTDQNQLFGKWRAPVIANIVDGNFAIDALQGDWSGKLAGAQVTGKVSIPVLGNWRESNAKIPTMDLQMNLNWPDSALETNIRADLEASSNADQVAAKGIAIKASGHNPSGKWQTDLSSPVKMDFGKQVVELANLTGKVSWIGISKDAKPFNLKLNGAGTVDLVREQARFNLNAGLDQSKFAAILGVNGWADPAYRIDASLDQLDLDRYFPPATKTIATKPIQKKSAPANLDLTFLKPLKVDGQIKIGVLKSAGTTARNVRIQMESAQLEKSKR